MSSFIPQHHWLRVCLETIALDDLPLSGLSLQTNSESIIASLYSILYLFHLAIIHRSIFKCRRIHYIRDSVTNDYERDECSLPEMRLLADLASADSIERVYREVIGVGRTLLNMGRCAVAVQQKNRLVVTESWEATPELETVSYALLTSHSEIREDKRSYCFDDVTEALSGSEPAGQSAQPRSKLCVPFNGDSVTIAESLTRGVFTDTDTEWVEIIANVAEGACANEYTRFDTVLQE